MENLKIRVSTAEERKEAMALFKNLGGMRSNSATDDRIGIVAMEFGEIYVDDSCHWGVYDGKETTLDRLRQMVEDKTQQSKDLKHGGELISGADALRALADGKEVEYLYGDKWFSVVGEQVIITSITENKFKFRLKPRTIKLELEIPAPFEPKDGDYYFILNPYCECGYSEERHSINYVSLGAWRTEEEIKQVVSALRSILNAKP